MEQLPLGCVGAETVNVALAWRWEDGWAVTITFRLSGSDSWRERRYAGREAEEACWLVSEALADVLRLV